ncbi:unnamed protein product [Trifolium pratense]|uniref:Uncharacterized protein n=1 Tax=Trifolium pratense TaxID=57577 RepID=A0ACB0LSC2_TRIPR|nr:unnamed protein product [Trifolium pratense]
MEETIMRLFLIKFSGCWHNSTIFVLIIINVQHANKVVTQGSAVIWKPKSHGAVLGGLATLYPKFENEKLDQETTYVI